MSLPWCNIKVPTGQSILKNLFPKASYYLKITLEKLTAFQALIGQRTKIILCHIAGIKFNIVSFFSLRVLSLCKINGNTCVMKYAQKL